jgi:hypothetical protein
VWHGQQRRISRAGKLSTMGSAASRYGYMKPQGKKDGGVGEYVLKL